MWRSGVPLAVQVSRGTTASESKKVVEPTVEVVKEIDRMVVLPEIGDAGDAGETVRLDALSEIVKAGGEADRADVLSEVQDPGGTGETDGANELTEIEGRGYRD